MGFLGIEKLHPFDASKWRRVLEFLVEDKVIGRQQVVEPREASEGDLLVVHSREYLQSLKSSMTVAQIVEIAPVALLPPFIVERAILKPFRRQVGGTVLAAKLAKERGWSINIGGGFHHASGASGSGFCVYADVSIAIHFAFERLGVKRAAIIDLDAHQGNGHETDFLGDERVHILDVYNRDVFPRDTAAKAAIGTKVELRSGASEAAFMDAVAAALQEVERKFSPDLVVYVAGTDCLEGDPLGRLQVSPQGIVRRDEMVFEFAARARAPIVMVTAGGYLKSNARIIADSISNLAAKGLIQVAKAGPAM